MNVLIVGRHQTMMDAVLSIAANAGFTATGVLTDDDAIRELETRNYAAVAIGGRVEPASRQVIKATAADNETAALDVFGPDDLINKLNQLG